MAIGTKIDRPRRMSVPPSADEAPVRPTLASAAPVGKSTPEDQVSIPPASDLGTHSAFALAETARVEPIRLPPQKDVEPDPRHVQIAGVSRASGAQRFTKLAVGLAAVVGLAVLVRVTITRFGHPPEQTARAAAAAPPQAGPQLPPPPPVEQTTAAPTPAAPAKSAMEEKKAALTALEKRDLTEAIAAGERSVDLDPTDADAWRILGAAYQDSGRLVEARRCFAECTKVAKKGEVRECSFLLQ